MKIHIALIDFVRREWLLVTSATGTLLTSLYLHHVPTISRTEWEVLFLLFALFVVVNGIQRSGLVTCLSLRLEQGSFVPLKLVLLSFLLSMFITNDVALVLVVPLTLALDVPRKDWLVILEALAVNAGSALSPIGNPQNLYIYWFYDLSIETFLRSIAPFSLFFLILLTALALGLFMRTEPKPAGRVVRIQRSVWIYLTGLVLLVLVVLHVLPLLAVAVVIGAIMLFDHRALRIDYALLFIFLFFFGLADNLQTVLSAHIAHSDHVFLFSALSSQFISNVPATVLYARFTQEWPALLWGVNVGGFGSLFGSLANLIAYRFYVTRTTSDDAMRFTWRFLLAGYLAFGLAIGWYFLVQAWG